MTHSSQVTVATTKLVSRTSDTHNGVRIAEFSIAATIAITGEVDRYQQFLLDGDFDIMLNYAAQQWTTDAAFPVLERLRFPAVLAPCGFSGLQQPSYIKLFQHLPSVLQAYRRLLFHSSTYQDYQFAVQHGLRHLAVVPNGASEEEFASPEHGFRARHGIADHEPLLVTIGSHLVLKGIGWR